MSGEDWAFLVVGVGLIVLGVGGLLLPGAMYWYLDNSTKKVAEAYARLGLRANLRLYPAQREVLRWLGPAVALFLGTGLIISSLL